VRGKLWTGMYSPGGSTNMSVATSGRHNSSQNAASEVSGCLSVTADPLVIPLFYVINAAGYCLNVLVRL